MSNQLKSGKMSRYLFFFVAGIIAIASIWVTNKLVDKLKEEERKKMEIWAESIAVLFATVSGDLGDDTFNNYDLLLTKIIETNTTIPVIGIDELGEIKENTYRNIHIPEQNGDRYLKEKVRKFAKKHDPITIKWDENTIRLYYDDSTVLKHLQLFPFVQLAIVFIFIIISFFALNSTQKAEQNKVWVGLSKETAHQLGTPISSLMAWVEYLKSKDMDRYLLDEMDKDVQRLKIIAERFSKIGSNPEPELIDLDEAVRCAIEYMERRISSKVNIVAHFLNKPLCVLMNESLLGWIIENLIKNAVDAMEGQGKITVALQEKGTKIIMDISDTGKGIPKSKFDAIFHPGYTTKKRGWGLGLSLAKRIIESYQKGKIYVHKSELGKGTTFRIELNNVINNNL